MGKGYKYAIFIMLALICLVAASILDAKKAAAASLVLGFGENGVVIGFSADDDGYRYRHRVDRREDADRWDDDDRYASLPGGCHYLRAGEYSNLRYHYDSRTGKYYVCR